MNELSQRLFGEKILQYHQSPSQPTGELFGVEYLRGQSDFLADELKRMEDVEVQTTLVSNHI